MVNKRTHTGLRIRSTGIRLVYFLLNLVPYGVFTEIKKQCKKNNRSRFWKAVGEKLLWRKSLDSCGKEIYIEEYDILLLNDNSYIVNRLYWLGSKGYEPSEVDVWRHICTRCATSKRKVVEIGANVGLFTVIGAKACAPTTYISVEPHPETYSSLEMNIGLNNARNVDAVQAACVDNSLGSTVTLAIPSSASVFGCPVGSYVMGASGIERDAREKMRVPAISSLELFEGCIAVKMDMEGMEGMVLKHSEEMIARFRPIILLEVRSKGLELQDYLCSSKIFRSGYDVFGIFAQGVYGLHKRLYRIKLTREDLGSLNYRFGTRDVVLCPKEMHHIIEEKVI